MKISKLAISNHQFTLIVFLLLVISGVVSFLTMPRSEDPQVSPNGTSILVIYPGASPSDLEQLVVDPIEEKINELTDIKRIESNCRDSIATIGVEFHANLDMDETYAELVQKVNSIRDKLPDDIAELEYVRWIMSDHVIILQLALISDTASFRLLDEHAERLKKSLEKIYGVKRARKWAIPEQEVRVSLDLEKLSQKRISMNQVMAAIAGGNFNIPGGNLDIGQRRFNIRTSGSYQTLDEIRNIIVHAYGEKVVFLRDIADVRLDYEDNLYLARVNGRRAVFVTVNQKDKTNIFQLMENIGAAVKEFRQILPPSISLETVFDQSQSVASRLNRFFSNLLQGLFLVGLVVLLALGVRPAVIVMLAIPISVFISIGFVDLSGLGLQQMAIAGLVIALGLLVDNAIVVTENISRYMKMGYSAEEAAVLGTGQIGGAIISSTVTTVLAFAPIAMMGYTSGQYIRSMPLTVIYTLLASLLVALTLTPFLSSRFLKIRQNHREIPFRRLLNLLIEKTYRPALFFSLNHPKILLSSVMAVFLMSLFVFSQYVGVSFFPKAEKPQLIINVDTPEGSNLARTDEVARTVEAVLENRNEISMRVTNVGRGNPTIHYNILSMDRSPHHAQIYLELKRYEPKLMLQLISDLRQEFDAFPGVQIEVKELEQGPPVEAPVAIKVLGENLDTLRAIAADVENIFLENRGTYNVHNPQKYVKTDLHVRINRAKAGMLGIAIVEIDRTIRAAIAGMTASSYRDEEGKEYDIVVRLPFENKLRPSDFQRIYVTSLAGAPVPLSQVAELTFKTVPKQIDHYNFDRTITITADVERGFSTDKVTKEIITQLEELSWPAGYHYYVAGEMESQQESFGGMGRAIIIALIAIFAVLVLQFRSFAQPLIVFTAIPLAVIGSIFALLITGNTFSFTAFVGLTSLVGIVVNNSIILVDYTNKLRAQKKSILEALMEAGPVRFVPIVLTTSTTVFGLLPLTLKGGTLWGPMGWTIIGGLMVSTFLTLIVVPVLYRILSGKE